jgi:hypothetical protein
MPIATISEQTVPHNLDAERGILGTILLDNEALPLVTKALTLSDFYSRAHRLTFEAMAALYENRTTVDLITLSEALEKKGLLEKVGGAAYLAALTDSVPIGTNAGLISYIKIVKRHSNLRQIIADSEAAIAAALAGTEDPEAIAGRIKAQAIDIETEIKEAKPAKVEPAAEQKERKRKEEERTYPVVPPAAWHPMAELYRQAHQHSTEGSDNWHFISFYTAVGSLLGRTVGTRMGGIIHPNLYSVLVGVIGGDGKDTCADFAMSLAADVDGSMFVPEGIDSKPGFCVAWQDHNNKKQVHENLRVILRMPEISTLLSVAAQKGTQSVVPMLLTHYAPRPFLANSTSNMQSRAEILNPHMSMLACGARKYIGEIPEKDLISGLGRRVCFVGGDTKAANANPPAPIESMLSTLKIGLKEVLEYWKQRLAHTIPLSAKAEKVWADWYKVYWRRKKGDDLIPAMNNGDRVTCRKIALINAALDRADEIEPRHLEPAIEFTSFLYDCRYPIFSEHGANPNLEIDKKILARIPEPPGRIGKRDLRRLCHLDAETFNKRIHWLLMDGGELRERQFGKKTYILKVDE